MKCHPPTHFNADIQYSLRIRFFFCSFIFFPSSFIKPQIIMATLEDKSLWDNQAEEDDDVGQDIIRLAPEEVNNRTRLLENDVKVKEAYSSLSL